MIIQGENSKVLATSWLGVSIASFDDSTRPRSIALKGGTTFPAWFNGVNSNKLLPHTRAAVFLVCKIAWQLHKFGAFLSAFIVLLVFQ